MRINPAPAPDPVPDPDPDPDHIAEGRIVIRPYKPQESAQIPTLTLILTLILTLTLSLTLSLPPPQAPRPARGPSIRSPGREPWDLGTPTMQARAQRDPSILISRIQPPKNSTMWSPPP